MCLFIYITFECENIAVSYYFIRDIAWRAPLKSLPCEKSKFSLFSSCDVANIILCDILGYTISYLNFNCCEQMSYVKTVWSIHYLLFHGIPFCVLLCGGKTSLFYLCSKSEFLVERERERDPAFLFLLFQ